MGRVDFFDDFASSSAELQVNDPLVIENPFARFSLYNRHLIELIEDFVTQVIDCGAPRVPFTLPLAYVTVTEEKLQECIKYIDGMLPFTEEQSSVWLLLQCYYRWVNACYLASSGAAPPIVAEEVLLAGAAARQIELAIKNRADAMIGKAVVRGARSGGNQRRNNRAPGSERILTEMHRLVEEGKSVSRAADIAARKGLGTTAGANRQLWYRRPGR